MITIIGILLGLLIPAVNMVREQGRQTTCLNNQMQIGQGDPQLRDRQEASSRRIGSAFRWSGSSVYNWVEALFPYLEHADMWESVVNNNVAQIKNMRVKVVVCPNDPYLVDVTAVTAQALLSYGVNDQFFVSYLGLSDAKANPPLDRTGQLASLRPLPRSSRTGRVPPPSPVASPSLPLRPSCWESARAMGLRNTRARGL